MFLFNSCVFDPILQALIENFPTSFSAILTYV